MDNTQAQIDAHFEEIEQVHTRIYNAVHDGVAHELGAGEGLHRQTIHAMNDKYIFNKEGGNWYVDLPDWTGPKAALEMVMGADTLLDVLSNGGEQAKLRISLDEPQADGWVKLTRTRLGGLTPEDGGAWYSVDIEGFPHEEIWLCDVTQFVFGFLPEAIWFKA